MTSYGRKAVSNYIGPNSLLKLTTKKTPKLLWMSKTSFGYQKPPVASGSPTRDKDCWMRFHVMTSSFRRTFQWRHNWRNGVPNHQPHDCLLNRLSRHRSKKTSKLCVTGLCAGNSPVSGEFPAQMASNAEIVSIRWRHHEEINCVKDM